MNKERQYFIVQAQGGIIVNTRVTKHITHDLAIKYIMRTLYYIFSSILAAAFLLPFLIMFVGSLDAKDQFLVTMTSWIPREYSISHYTKLLTSSGEVPRWVLNSFVISVIPTITGVLIASALGYIFAKKEFRGKNMVFWYFMMAIMVPYQATIVSNYMVYNALGWLDTYTAFLVPGMFTVIYMFMMRQFIVTIPDSLIESAKIDGAGELRVYFQIIIPLSTPALSTVAIFTFIDKWNDFMSPLLFATSSKMFNLVVGLATFIQTFSSFTIQMASGVIICIPTFIIFLCLQKYFVDGIVMGAVKG